MQQHEVLLPAGVFKLHAQHVRARLRLTRVSEGKVSAFHVVTGGRIGRDIFCGSGFILQMNHDIILLFSKCYENT